MTDQEATMPDAEVRPYNDLLREWTGRPRTLGRHEASHPVVLRRVMAALDADGPSEAGDAIQSLVWDAEIGRQRARYLAERDDKAALVEALKAARGSLAAVGVFGGRGLRPDFMPALSAHNEADAHELERAYWAIWDALESVGEL